MKPLYTSLSSCRIIHFFEAFSFLAIACVAPLTTSGRDVQPCGYDSPWGIGTGGEWSRAFPRFIPLVAEAGATSIRLWPEWNAVQPSKETWNWAHSDRIAETAKENGIKVLGMWCYFAKWASADGGTRQGPISDMQGWKDYIATSIERYGNDVKYWEVWNEFNGSFYSGINKPQEYAALTVAAYNAAKSVNPSVMVGMSVANFDLAFLERAIQAGAADHFDFIAVHPYENHGGIEDGGEIAYLSLTRSLRQMLEKNGQNPDMPLWITEVGTKAPIDPDLGLDLRQASQLIKCYVLSIAQGFDNIMWFEVRGPAYGHRTDYGIIRKDWTLRPAYLAFKNMTQTLGRIPRYKGWLELPGKSFGFVFTNEATHIVSAWSPVETESELSFETEVRIVDLVGNVQTLAAGRPYTLTNQPVFIMNIPQSLADLADSSQNYPWEEDFTNINAVSIKLGAINQEKGIKQVKANTTEVVNELTKAYLRTDIKNRALKGEGNYVYFRVSPAFAPYGTNELSITVVAKRLAPDKNAGTNLQYESIEGYRQAEGWWNIPKGEGWHEHTWTIKDANFIGQWGWNFRLNAMGSKNDFLLKEVRVTKPR